MGRVGASHAMRNASDRNTDQRTTLFYAPHEFNRNPKRIVATFAKATGGPPAIAEAKGETWLTKPKNPTTRSN